jgi:predicted alternative tryptophan synthase beta-subunit
MTAIEWLVEQLPIYGYNVVTVYPELIEQAKEMEKQQGYSGEEVKNIMAETWIQCVGNDGNNFKEVRDKILNN